MTPKQTIIDTLGMHGSLHYDDLARKAGLKPSVIDGAMGGLLKYQNVIYDPGGTYRLPHSITIKLEKHQNGARN